MTDEPKPLTDAPEDPLNDDGARAAGRRRTDDAHRWLAFRAVREIVALRRQVAPLTEEVNRLRLLFARAYHFIPGTIGTEELQAELEREAARLGVIKPGKPDVH